MTPAPKKPAAKAPAKREPAKAEKPTKPAPEKTETEGPGDDDSMPDFATYPGVVPADQGDQGRI